MILDTTDKSLRAVMGADHTTTAPVFSVSYVAIDVGSDGFAPLEVNGEFTGDATIELVPVPGGGTTQNQIKFLNIFNADSVQQTFQVYILDGANVRVLFRGAIAAGKSLWWTPESGWVPGGVAGPQGDTGLTGDTGPVGMLWRGAWNSGTAYALRDGVLYNGNAYISIQAGTNKVPNAEPTYWSLMAEKGTNGSNGSDGADGSDGLDFGFNYLWNTTTTPGNPGTGKVAADNGTFASITQISFNETDNDGRSLAGFINAWDDSTNTNKGIIFILDPANPANYIIARHTTMTDSGSYDVFNVAVLASGGALSNNLPVKITWVPYGDKGTNGVDGDDGVGVPAAGTTGQLLAKNSGTDYDTEWVDPPTGGGGGEYATGSVYLSANDISVPSATPTVMIYDAEEWDSASIYNTSDGKISPGIDCYVDITALVWMSTSANNFFTVFEIYVNNVLRKAIAEPIPEASAAANTVFAFNCSGRVKIDAGDYVTVKFQQHSGGSKNMTKGIQKNWMQFIVTAR